MKTIVVVHSFVADAVQIMGGYLVSQSQWVITGMAVAEQSQWWRSVSKSDTRPDRNSEVGRSKNGSVSKSDTRPDGGRKLVPPIAGGDVERYDVKEQLSWGCDAGTAWYV